MFRRFAQMLTIAFVLSGMFASAAAAKPRDVVNLDGVWNFATDPDNRGETEKWYQPTAQLPAMPLPGYAPAANGKIQVPGVWDNQGYGTETDKVRHNFVGKGWYKRQIEIPQSWAGRRTFLVITGISRYAKVWVDEQFLGEHIGYLSAQEYDITPYAAPGKTLTITIQVDSKQRWEVDTMSGASSLIDYIDVAWGGIWGHVFLEARSDAWLKDLYIQPDVPGSACTASATLQGKTELADTAKLDVFDKSGQRVAESAVKLDSQIAAGQAVNVKAALPNAALWTPDSPTLYTARLSLLKGGQVLDTVESRFGMRQFAIDGYRILLNGKPLMLCGYGDDHIYPEQMGMPSDKELHLRRLRMIKSYGFNHVRHHSTTMPPEYYDACDEVGIISTCEFPIAYFVFLPGVGDTWRSHVPEGTDPSPAVDTYHREWTAVVKQNRNHPSILCWVMGNELWPNSLSRGFQQIAQEHDPTRCFVDSDGAITVNLQAPEYARDTLAFWSIDFSEQTANPIRDPDKFRTPQPKKPVIAHETANYVTFSRPDLVDQFQQNIKPYWIAAGKQKLEKLGLLEEGNRWAEKSERLYALLHKYNVESLRKNPFISGYHWWLFQDYWTSSNGIVDHYFRPKSITKEEVRKYNNEVVLLQDGLDRTYRGKSRLELKLLVSNFSPDPLQGELVWEVKAGGQSIAKRQVSLNNVSQGELAEATKISLELPDTSSPAKLTITTELVAGEKRFSNDWCSWLYPAVIRPAAFPVPVFADEAQIERCKDWGVKPIPAAGDLDSRAVYVIRWPCDSRVVDALKRGACVVMLDGAGQILPSRGVTFRTSWWKAGDGPDFNHTGTFVYDHPATRAMAPDGWCDDGWLHLIEGAVKCVLESAPARPNVIVRALPSLAWVEDDALLFEVGVEKGTLIVSGLNHRDAQNRPENEWIITRLLDYAATMPRVKVQWPASFLKVLSVAPEGCLPGFNRLAANEGEETHWHSYREDNAQVFVCRQTEPGNLVSWETAPVPKDASGDCVTFVFAGGLGFISEPATEGFALDINGKEVLRFNLPEPKFWQSPDKRVTLWFDSRRILSVDQFGLFRLTVPRDMLKPGEPCVLGVRSVGTGSRRWFGLNPYL